jgi:hypothetical protein
LTINDLYQHVPAGCYLEAESKGSRSRDHAFEVHMTAEPGSDKHGIKRCYATNSGNYGKGHGKAATYIEWGDWMVELFKIDPQAIIGPYEGREDFVLQTHDAVSFRPQRENAEDHADRWSKELFYALA